MLSLFLIYLLKASLFLGAFAIAYQFLLRRLTYFKWNRYYLIVSLFLSLLMPLIEVSYLSRNFLGFIPMQELRVNLNLDLEAMERSMTTEDTAVTATGQVEESFTLSLVYLLSGIYLIGFIYRTIELLLNLRKVFRLINSSKKERKDGYYLVHIKQGASAFSFLSYIFLPCENHQLCKNEIGQILHHEQVHVKQKHTLDLLLFEVAGIVFWFNPFLYFMKLYIREVHEYLADVTVTGRNGGIKNYSELLIKLATSQANEPLLNTFSDKQIIQRITMLTQTKSKPMQKLKFLFVIPVLAITLVLCSFLGNEELTSKAAIAKSNSGSLNFTDQSIKIAKISWLGNTAFTEAALNEALELKVGDPYNAEDLEKRLNYNPDGPDISSLYMDKGHLFFSVELEEDISGNSVNLTLSINEGPKVSIGQIIIKGNKKIATEEILKKVELKKDDLFNRSKLINSQKNIAEMGHFDPENVAINPVPYQKSADEGGEWIVDLEFVVEEI